MQYFFMFDSGKVRTSANQSSHGERSGLIYKSSRHYGRPVPLDLLDHSLRIQYAVVLDLRPGPGLNLGQPLLPRFNRVKFGRLALQR